MTCHVPRSRYATALAAAAVLALTVPLVAQQADPELYVFEAEHVIVGGQVGPLGLADQLQAQNVAVKADRSRQIADGE